MPQRNLSQQEWTALRTQFPPGSPVSGTVRNQVPYGVWVTLDELPTVPALLEIFFFAVLDREPNRRLQFPADYPEVGTRLEATILGWYESQNQVRLTQLSGEAKETFDDSAEM